MEEVFGCSIQLFAWYSLSSWEVQKDAQMAQAFSVAVAVARCEETPAGVVSLTAHRSRQNSCLDLGGIVSKRRAGGRW